MGYMKLLIPITDLQKYKSRDLIPAECYHCHNTFQIKKHYVQCSLSKGSHTQGKFCSRKCHSMFSSKKIKLNCKHCGKILSRVPCEINKTKYSFCSSKCSGTYWSGHKTTGSHRSKLEIWLEAQLKLIYPNLIFSFNDKETIFGELDIYIPSLKLAFELNGIFHYEPIFGQDKLTRTQDRDSRKFQKCMEKQISLCVIDTSKQKYIKEKYSRQFLEIITKIINEKLEEGTGVQPDPV